MDGVFCVCDNEFYQRVVELIKKEIQVGSEDMSDIVVVGQRVCWVKTQSEACVRVDQGRAIEELSEIEF